jgi:hypothetical protein
MSVDQSPYTIEQRLVTAVWLHERPYSGDTMKTVKVKFRDRFGVEPPRKATMMGLGKIRFRNRQCERPSTRWPTNNEVGNIPRRGGISDAMFCEIHSKKVS